MKVFCQNIISKKYVFRLFHLKVAPIEHSSYAIWWCACIYRPLFLLLTLLDIMPSPVRGFEQNQWILWFITKGFYVRHLDVKPWLNITVLHHTFFLATETWFNLLYSHKRFPEKKVPEHLIWANFALKREKNKCELKVAHWLQFE